MSEDVKPAFCPVEIDELDRKLAQTAARKRIPSLRVEDILEPSTETEAEEHMDTPADVVLVQPALRKTLSLEVPDYLWVELKTTAAKQMITVRHLILKTLIENGFEVRDVDMVEDGRRLR